MTFVSLTVNFMPLPNAGAAGDQHGSEPSEVTVESNWLDMVRTETERLTKRFAPTDIDPDAPAPDPAMLAKAMGIHVFTRRDISGAYRTSRDGCHLILLPPFDRPQRRAYAIAHELGEIHLPTVPDFLPPEAGESLGPEMLIDRAVYQDRVHQAAVWFAMFLLVPECAALADFDPHASELAMLKGRFPHASHEVLAVRVAQRTDSRVTVTDNGRLTRRSNFGAWMAFGAHWHPTERCVHDRVATSGQTCRLADRGVQVAGFPFFEPEVRRIILISHFDEAYQEEE